MNSGLSRHEKNSLEIMTKMKSILLTVGLVSGTAALAAAPPGWMPSEDTDYREQVIASAGEMDVERGARTARHAYRAMDEGPDSTAAADLQGFDAARRLVWSYEFRKEVAPVQVCTTAYVQQGGAAVGALIAQRIATSSRLPRLVALAEAEAGDSFAAALAAYAAPSEADRAMAALAALLSSGMVAENYVAAAAAAYFIAAGSDGKCPAPERLLLLIENQQ